MTYYLLWCHWQHIYMHDIITNLSDIPDWMLEPNSGFRVHTFYGADTRWLRQLINKHDPPY